MNKISKEEQLKTEKDEAMERDLNKEYDKMRTDFIYSKMDDQLKRPGYRSSLFKCINERKALSPSPKLGKENPDIPHKFRVMLCEKERQLVTEQALEAGYSPEVIKVILNCLEESYKAADGLFVSCKLKDYTIDKDGNATLKSRTERYDNLLADQHQRALDEGQDYATYQFPLR